MENQSKEKARYWSAVLYPENMIENWEDNISDILQLPFAYCIHDKDKDGHNGDRKKHIHLIICFPNTTTYKNALNIVQLLGEKCCNKVERVISIRNCYEYLIHNTETCKKKGKYLYSIQERITGNNFDIGAFEQLSTDEKKKMRMELSRLIFEKGFMNYLDFYVYVVEKYDSQYEEVVVSYSGHFERLTKGNFQNWNFERMNR